MVVVVVVLVAEVFSPLGTVIVLEPVAAIEVASVDEMSPAKLKALRKAIERIYVSHLDRQVVVVAIDNLLYVPEYVSVTPQPARVRVVHFQPEAIVRMTYAEGYNINHPDSLFTIENPQPHSRETHSKRRIEKKYLINWFPFLRLYFRSGTDFRNNLRELHEDH
ncbi:hypothetical protein DICVIV_04553 [Dictyocaulus viviparus]|uniref:Uncharacterized protein n=1 Tax=Dictyocaulus viviparus TaxID=29172 RepID=A0A0D8XZV2_DICVI|nr:hypothetical protein DICVIV_04553 [Dictyocaulus viviparus]